MHWHDCVDLGVHSKPSGPHPSQCGPAQLKRSDFSSRSGRPALCFPTLPVPELVMCKLFKIYLSSRNVRCLKLCIGLWKWMSNFKEQKGTYFWSFRDPRLHCPAIWTARILEVLYITSLKNFALQANYLILLSSNLNHVSMFDYFCWMYTVFCLRQIFGDFICSGISWSKLQTTETVTLLFSNCV